MGPPKPPVPHVAGIYRYTATALGAGMWFWVCQSVLRRGIWRWVKNWADSLAVDVQSKEGRYAPPSFTTDPTRHITDNLDSQAPC
jgi:hypothetical protein